MSETRRTISFEVLLVLGVSLGASAASAVLDLAGKLAEHTALSQQQSTLNPSRAAGHPGLDLAYQLVGISFSLVPALLALHLLRRSGHDDPLGFHPVRPVFDLGAGALLAAAIGVPGIALYAFSRSLGINSTVIPEALPHLWWTAPVLLLAALADAFLEEVIVVGYLVRRLRELAWSAPLLVAASVFLRGTYHLYQGFGGFIGNLVMGALFALFYLRFGRLGPLIIAHALIDSAAFVGYAYLHPLVHSLGI